MTWKTFLVLLILCLPQCTIVSQSFFVVPHCSPSGIIYCLSDVIYRPPDVIYCWTLGTATHEKPWEKCWFLKMLDFICWSRFFIGCTTKMKGHLNPPRIPQKCGLNCPLRDQMVIWVTARDGHVDHWQLPHGDYDINCPLRDQMVIWVTARDGHIDHWQLPHGDYENLTMWGSCSGRCTGCCTESVSGALG